MIEVRREDLLDSHAKLSPRQFDAAVGLQYPPCPSTRPALRNFHVSFFGIKYVLGFLATSRFIWFHRQGSVNLCLSSFDPVEAVLDQFVDTRSEP